MKRYLTILLFILVGIPLYAQETDRKLTQAEKREQKIDKVKAYMLKIQPNTNADSVRAELEKGPYFRQFKDCYFIGGIPLGQKIMSSNSNVKFQISVIQQLTRSRLPFDSYLFIQFTQKTIWNVLEESLPMRDLNFNPAIGLGHIIVNDNRYVGRAVLMIEHESNGKDGEMSRSWNKVSFGISRMMSRYMNFQVKAWYPIVDGVNNKDILRYNGLGHIGFNYRSENNHFRASMLATWRTRSFSFNTQWEAAFKLSNNENQYFFVQYYNGYGENLLDYNQYKSVIRIGFVIKPQDFSIF